MLQNECHLCGSYVPTSLQLNSKETIKRIQMKKKCIRMNKMCQSEQSPVQLMCPHTSAAMLFFSSPCAKASTLASAASEPGPRNSNLLRSGALHIKEFRPNPRCMSKDLGQILNASEPNPVFLGQESCISKG